MNSADACLHVFTYSVNNLISDSISDTCIPPLYLSPFNGISDTLLSEFFSIISRPNTIEQLVALNGQVQFATYDDAKVI